MHRVLRVRRLRERWGRGRRRGRVMPLEVMRRNHGRFAVPTQRSDVVSSVCGQTSQYSVYRWDLRIRKLKPELIKNKNCRAIASYAVLCCLCSPMQTRALLCRSELEVCTSESVVPASARLSLPPNRTTSLAIVSHAFRSGIIGFNAQQSWHKKRLLKCWRFDTFKDIERQSKTTRLSSFSSFSSVFSLDSPQSRLVLTSYRFKAIDCISQPFLSQMVRLLTPN